MAKRDPVVRLSDSGKRWIAALSLGLGLMGVGLPWLFLAEQQSTYDTAAYEQSFQKTTCTVTDSRMLENQGKDSGQRTLQVDFSMRAEGTTFDQLSYTYGVHSSPGAVIPAGRSVPCFYDRSRTSTVVLIQKSAPDGERPGLGLLHVVFIGMGLLFCALGVFALRTKRALHIGDIPDIR